VFTRSHNNNYSAPVPKRCIAISLSVCLCVCLSVREHISGTAGPILNEIVCADLLWPWLDPPLVALRYVMYFRFYGWRHVWP